MCWSRFSKSLSWPISYLKISTSWCIARGPVSLSLWCICWTELDWNQLVFGCYDGSRSSHVCPQKCHYFQHLEHLGGVRTRAIMTLWQVILTFITGHCDAVLGPIQIVMFSLQNLYLICEFNSLHRNTRQHLTSYLSCIWARSELYQSGSCEPSSQQIIRERSSDVLTRRSPSPDLLTRLTANHLPAITQSLLSPPLSPPSSAFSSPWSASASPPHRTVKIVQSDGLGLSVLFLS